jgi:hypothetical protein
MNDHVEALTRASINLDDSVSLAEFSELEWELVPRVDGGGAKLPSTASNRHSWMRTRISRTRSQGSPAESPLPTPVPSPAHIMRYRLGDLIEWVEEPGNRRVRFERDWLWALQRAARVYVENEDQIDRTFDEAGQTANDHLRHFVVGLVLFCARNGDTSEIDPEIIEELLDPAMEASLVQVLRKRAARGAEKSDQVAERLMADVDAGSIEVARCAQAVVAGLIDENLPASSVLAESLGELVNLSPRRGATTTSLALAGLMSGLVDLSPGKVVIDPACGEGELLLAAARAEAGLVVVGRDNQEVCTYTTWALLHLKQLDPDIRVADSLNDGRSFPRADVVLLDPPVLKGVHVRRWLSLATQLCPDGQIVTILPGVSLRPGRREWEEAKNRVKAVIACPARTKTDTGDAPAVWVLGDNDEDRPVLIVDAAPEASGPLTIESADELAGSVLGWLRTGTWSPPSGVPVEAESFPRSFIDMQDGELRLRELLSRFVGGTYPDDAPYDPLNDTRTISKALALADVAVASIESDLASGPKRLHIDRSAVGISSEGLIRLLAVNLKRERVDTETLTSSLRDLARLLLDELRASKRADSAPTQLESALSNFVSKTGGDGTESGS